MTKEKYSIEHATTSSSDDEEIIDKVILAPMVRGSELAFRTMIRRYGIKHCYSPMLRAVEVVKAYHIWNDELQLARGRGRGRGRGRLRDSDDFDFLSRIEHEDGILLVTDICGRHSHSEDQGQLTVQLCGCCPDTLFEATQILMELQISQNMKLEGIDLNLGCPQKCAEDGCFGAFLAERQPTLAAQCVAAMRRAIDNFNPNTEQNINVHRPRLSCKIRLLDTDNDTISFAEELQAAGCEIITVHCRHRIDKFNGKPDLISGKKIVDALSIPVIINGSEVSNVEDVRSTLRKTGAHAVMIARAFLTNPGLLQPRPQPQPQRDDDIRLGVDPAFLAAEYLDCCEKYPPPSPLYIQKHLRWIFRKYLQPERSIRKATYDYNDWRVRLWTFLVRPFLETIFQFRQVVVLYAKLNGSGLPISLRDQPLPSFKSIKNSRKIDTSVKQEELSNRHAENDDDDDEEEESEEDYQTELLVNLFQ